MGCSRPPGWRSMTVSRSRRIDRTRLSGHFAAAGDDHASHGGRVPLRAATDGRSAGGVEVIRDRGVGHPVAVMPRDQAIREVSGGGVSPARTPVSAKLLVLLELTFADPAILEAGRHRERRSDELA